MQKVFCYAEKFLLCRKFSGYAEKLRRKFSVMQKSFCYAEKFLIMQKIFLSCKKKFYAESFLVCKKKSFLIMRKRKLALVQKKKKSLLSMNLFFYKDNVHS